MEPSKLNEFFSEAEQKAIQADALIAQLKATLIQQTAQVEFIAAELQAKWLEVESYKSKFVKLWNPAVDYSFITDDSLVEKLESDCRKMAVSRSGFRGSSRKDDFAEYCGYVQLQIEGCFDYYYRTITRNSIVDYNILGSRIAALAGKIFKPQTYFSYGTFFYLSNIEFSLYDNHKYYYFLIRDLMNYRNTQIFHRGTGAGDELDASPRASLQRLIDSKNFAKVESALHFVVNLVREALIKIEIREPAIMIEENKASEDPGTYAKEVEANLLVLDKTEPMPQIAQLTPVPKAADNK